jgi:threonylcarbamoyladenosine tRNA methylthiotransferase MtaB
VNVFYHTFGCKANQYDTELVRQAFDDGGAGAVDAVEDADVAVINSCTVTHTSEAKLRSFVRRLARSNPGVRTVVMGCAAARDDGALAALPGVQAVIGGADPAAVLAAAGVALPNPERRLRRFASGARAWLKIQDGCDEHCTFCATTLARGANRSRAVADLVAEARQLAEHHAEIVLTGVHIGTYGKDGDRSPGTAGERSLGQLLEALINGVPDVRFRLSSVEATEVDDDLERLMVEAPRNLAAHLHAPLQSGSDRLLKRMGRHWYTRDSYRHRIEQLAARLPVFGLGADIIAGFPGESDADHRATVDLVNELPFTYLHVFPFSMRPDVAAGRLPDPVSDARVRQRAAELRALGEMKADAHRLARRGARADGVVSGREGGRLEILTEDYLTVYYPSEQWDLSPRFEVTVA